MIKRTLDDDNAKEILSYDELMFVINTTIESVDIEITRIVNEKELSSVVENLILAYRNANYFSFFTLLNLKYTTENIFSTEALRDFILNVTDRVSASLPYSEKDEDRLIKTIVRSICRNKTDSENSLMVQEVKESIFVNREVLHTCLKDNFWLIIYYLITVHLHKSEAYESYNASLNK